MQQRFAGEDIVGRRRRTAEELAQKVGLADQLAAQGERQKEIARTLGVSVMTLHRWRKMQAQTAARVQDQRRAKLLGDQPVAPLSLATAGLARPLIASSTRVRDARALERENHQLRWLIADLLLERVAAEEYRPPQGLRRHAV